MKKLLLTIFGDILFLYKNFLHFILSKILILLTVLLILIAIFIPIILIFGFLFYVLGAFDGNFNPYMFLGNWYYMISGIFLIIISFFVYVIGYSWSQILLIKLSLGYQERKKLALGKNYYFDFKLFGYYIKLSLVLIGLLLTPFILWSIIFFVVIIIFGGIEASLSIVNSGMGNPLSLSLLILSLFSIIFFLYLSYKTLFTYIIFTNKYSENKKFKNITYYIKESFNFTKGYKKFFKLMLVLFITLLVSSPIFYFEEYFSNKSLDIKEYITLNSVVKAGGDLKEKTLDFEVLSLEYSDSSIEDLSYDLIRNNNLSMLFYILEFLILWGLYNMVLVSFYKNEKDS